MATRRRVESASELIEPDDADVKEARPAAETKPAVEPDPFVIGPPSAAMTPGWLMGIGSRPQTPAEHATRLGVSAGTFRDAGFLTGSLASRANWPAQPVVVEP